MNEKSTYSTKELTEFKKIILAKIESAQEDLAILRAATANDSDNGTEDTSPSFKAFEEGSATLSKTLSSLKGRLNSLEACRMR